MYLPSVMTIGIGPGTFVVHPTLTVLDRQTREVMATPGGKMMNVRGVTKDWPPFVVHPILRVYDPWP